MKLPKDIVSIIRYLKWIFKRQQLNIKYKDNFKIDETYNVLYYRCTGLGVNYREKHVYMSIIYWDNPDIYNIIKSSYIGILPKNY